MAGTDSGGIIRRRGIEQKQLLKEADELTAIFTASYKTAKENLKKTKGEQKRQSRRD